MKKIFLAALGAVLTSFADADDGSWYDARGYTPAEGALYSQGTDSEVAMDKEYLELSDYQSGRTRAVFLFRNTGAKALTLECAFPIRLSWAVQPLLLGSNGKAIWQESEDDRYSRGGWDFGPSSKYAPQAPGPYDKDIQDWLRLLGISSESWEPDDFGFGGLFIAAQDYPQGRKEYPARTFLETLGLSITQDAKAVPIETVVADFGHEPGVITLHFRHKLTFSPNGSRVVEVSYSLPKGDSSSGSPYDPGHNESWNWNYILETGASWKGPIGELVLAVPTDFSGWIPDALQAVGISGGSTLYRAVSWEPKAEDNLDLTWTRPFFGPDDVRQRWTDPIFEMESVGSLDENIEVLLSSSELAETADIYLRTGYVKKVDFSAGRLFDGLRETCWVEGRTNDGIGEYVAVRIRKPMVALAVQNGFLRSPINLPGKDLWSVFEKNNRVKLLEIRSADGQKVLKELPLADSRDLQYFNVPLPAGQYRITIAAVYPGTKWKDTCLGELTFFPGVIGEWDRLKSDSFFKAFMK